jgi:secondary thiamine-phosphate synthase enzyme
MQVLSIPTRERCQMVDVSREISRAVKDSRIANGICIVYVPHTTAGITINENADPDVARDMLAAFTEMVPKLKYRHLEGNSDAHIKAALVGTSQTVIIENGLLQLGTWQGIYLCEFDGPRTRKIYVQITHINKNETNK